MRNRFTLLSGMLLAFLLGIGLASTSVPDVVWDLVLDLRTAFKRYQLHTGASSTAFLMVAGFLLGQGLFLLLRQLWVDVLRQARARSLEVDAAVDAATLLPARFILRRYLEQAVEGAIATSSTTHVSLALFRVRGLDQLNRRGGFGQGTALLRALAAEVKDAAISRALVGWSRRRAVRRLTPWRLLHDAPLPPRCPARLQGDVLALAMRAQDARDAYLLASQLCRLLHERARAEAGVSVVGAIAIRTQGARYAHLLQGALAALDHSAAPGQVVVAHNPRDSTATVLQEYPDVQRVDLPFDEAGDHQEGERPPGADADAAGPSRWWPFLRGWGLGLACVAAAPLVLVLGRGELTPEVAYPWPDTLTEINRLGASGLKPVKLQRSAARALLSERWSVERARVVQLHQGESGQAQVQLALRNSSDAPRHLSMYDVRAIDANGQQLEVDPRASLQLARPLGSQRIAPGEAWTGWLIFHRGPAPIVALLISPSRRVRLYLPLQAPPAG